MHQSPAQVYFHVIFSTNQMNHRKKMSFQEEYCLFLQKHCLDFDEAHVWDQLDSHDYVRFYVTPSG
jgi:hypothetical protein